MRAFLAAAAALLFFRACADEDVFSAEDVLPFDRFCASAGGVLFLPQGGAGAGRLGGVAVRAGWYATEFTAFEAAAMRLENRFGASAGVLWHWWGYERFDPFFVYGASWAEGVGAGPSAGAGFYWHIDERWSFRLDAAHSLLVDGGVAGAFTFSCMIRATW